MCTTCDNFLCARYHLNKVVWHKYDQILVHDADIMNNCQLSIKYGTNFTTMMFVAEVVTKFYDVVLIYRYIGWWNNLLGQSGTLYSYWWYLFIKYITSDLPVLLWLWRKKQGILCYPDVETNPVNTTWIHR